MSRTDYQSIAARIASVELQIEDARDGDRDDMLNVCESLLDLIELLNQREIGE